MAIFRLSAQLVKRSAGRSATAAAAYRAGIRITRASVITKVVPRNASWTIMLPPLGQHIASLGL
jgi:hypothetical protein